MDKLDYSDLDAEIINITPKQKRRGTGRIKWFVLAALLLRAANCVLDRNHQRRIFTYDFYCIHFNQIAKPLLKRALHKELCSGCQLVAIWREDHSLKPATKIRAIDTFTR